MPAARPLVILVTGAPGSGKTTLAAHLASRLGLAHLNRDDCWRGLVFTDARSGTSQVNERGVVAHFGAIEHLLALGVSLIADGTMYRGESEESLRRLLLLADVANLHCPATDATARLEARERVNVDAVDSNVKELLERVSRNSPLFTDPLELDCPLLEVLTDDGYEPGLDAIEAWLREK